MTSGTASADNIFVSNNNGTTIEEISNGAASAFVTNPANLNGPTGLAFNKAGDLFVANNGSGNVVEFSPSGAFLGNYGTGMFSARGIAFDSAGNLFVANQGNGTIVKIPVGGGSSSVFASGLSAPNGLAFDSAGNLYVADGVSGVIDEISPSQVVTPFVTGLDSPNGLAFDSSGNLLVVNHGTSQVLKFSPTGTALGPVITDGDISASLKTLAVDSQGNIFVSDNVENKVTEYDASGNTLKVYTGANGLNGPYFITTQLVSTDTPVMPFWGVATVTLLLFLVASRYLSCQNAPAPAPNK
ncbi:MAG: NHL repeat-containing protein [Methylacidiphilales bacterium]|nr:NHL repeat-containing protein [Candidatus Methylacidiphilales bacterium]